MDPEGFAVAPKKLTLSTVGILPALEKLMQEPVRPNLAISLHAPNKELRRELMPIEERYDIKDVIAAAQRYPIPRGGRRDLRIRPARRRQRPAGARAGRSCACCAAPRGKVNLIPLNPAPEIPFAPPTPEAVDEFCRILVRRARHRLRAPAARAGHPRRLRPAPPQARGRCPCPLPSRPERAARVPRRPACPGPAQIALVLALSRRRAPAVPRRGAARAGRDLLHGRRARHGRDAATGWSRTTGASRSSTSPR